MSKTWLIYLLVLGAILWAIGASIMPSEPQYGFRINDSASLPHRLFFRAKCDPKEIVREQIVAFRHPLSSLPLAKQVVGLPGDIISVDRNRILINGRDLGEIKTISPSGKRLTPIQDGVIPDGFLFVYAGHELSFDSRYAELGLIAIADIEDILWPIY